MLIALQSHFVQISESRSDGQVVQVVRKDDFGSRIRNAVVYGDCPEAPSQHDDVETDPEIKLEDAISPKIRSPSAGYSALRSQAIPPQLLVLMLESGLIVFLFLVQKHPQYRSWEFVTNTYQTLSGLQFLGFHFAIDPFSRYLAAASTQHALVVFELEPWYRLEEQYRENGSIKPVKVAEFRTFQGTLMHLGFLYPRPQDDNHTILLMIVARRDTIDQLPASRMLIFDWMVGDNVENALGVDHPGTRLSEEYRMPLLVIPIKFQNSFFLVFQHSILVVRQALAGVPELRFLSMADNCRQTSLHHGNSEPLWAAWARPVRLKRYFAKTDVIYLAREDGLLVHVEIDGVDVVPAVTSAGCVDSNISTAFAAAYDKFADVIIVGGDSGPGGTWKVRVPWFPELFISFSC